MSKLQAQRKSAIAYHTKVSDDCRNLAEWYAQQAEAYELNAVFCRQRYAELVREADEADSALISMHSKVEMELVNR